MVKPYMIGMMNKMEKIEINNQNKHKMIEKNKIMMEKIYMMEKLKIKMENTFMKEKFKIKMEKIFMMEKPNRMLNYKPIVNL